METEPLGTGEAGEETHCFKDGLGLYKARCDEHPARIAGESSLYGVDRTESGRRWTAEASRTRDLEALCRARARRPGCAQRRGTHSVVLGGEARPVLSMLARIYFGFGIWRFCVTFLGWFGGSRAQHTPLFGCGWRVFCEHLLAKAVPYPARILVSAGQRSGEPSPVETELTPFQANIGTIAR